jgi:hypothetical protein
MLNSEATVSDARMLNESAEEFEHFEWSERRVPVGTDRYGAYLMVDHDEGRDRGRVFVWSRRTAWSGATRTKNWMETAMGPVGRSSGFGTCRRWGDLPLYVPYFELRKIGGDAKRSPKKPPRRKRRAVISSASAAMLVLPSASPASSPVIGSCDAGAATVAARDVDCSPAGWRPELLISPEAGASRAAPAMTASGGGRVELFAVTNPQQGPFGARRLVNVPFRGDRWGGPSLLGAARLRDTAPAAISRRDGHVDVFAVGADEDDGKLITWWNPTGQPGGWQGPLTLPGDKGLLSKAAPAVASWHQDRLDVFGVSNPDGVFGPRRLVHWFWEGDGWGHDRIENSRVLDVSPAVVSRRREQLDIFAVGADDLDGRVVTWWWDQGWGGPHELPGQRAGMVAGGGPAAVSTNPSRLDVVAVSREGDLLHWHWDGSGWHGPSVHTTTPKLDPASRPWITRVPGQDGFDIFATMAPDGVAGSRSVVHRRAEGGVLGAQTRLLSWQNAFGPAAAYDSAGRLHVASARDDGKLATSMIDDTYRRPGPPALTVTAKAYNHMRLDWSLPPGAVRTEVWSRSEFLGVTTDHRITTVAAPGMSFEEDRLWPGGARYCYKVRAVDELNGAGDFSDVACAQMDPPRVTPSPTVGQPDVGFASWTDATGQFDGGGVVLNSRDRTSDFLANEPITVTWAGGNFGAVEAPAHTDTLLVYRHGDGPETLVHRDDPDVPALAPGAQHPQQSSITLGPGSYRVVVTLDSGAVTGDPNRANNDTSREFRVEAA